MWNKMRRLAVPVALPLSVVVLVAVLLIQPWEGGDEATGAVIEYRFCNTVVRVPADQLEVRYLSEPLVGDSPPSRPPAMQLVYKQPKQESSFITIDAESGQTIVEEIRAEDRPFLDAALATKRIEQAEPTFWPYGDQVQVSPEYTSGVFHYRYPDPGAGIALFINFPYSQPTELVAINCRSIMTLKGRMDGGVDADYSKVSAEDRDAFEKFVAEVGFEAN